MFTVKTELNSEVQTELSRPVYITSLIMLIIGSVGLVAYIVLGTIFDNTALDYMLAFAVPFGFGLVFLITVKKMSKNIEKIKQTNEYTFEQDYMSVTTYRFEENEGSIKVYYRDLVKSRETKKYIFMYINKVSALAVDKTLLTEDELIILKSLLGLKIKK